MPNFIKLSQAVKYSTKRVGGTEVTLQNFVTIDNILQNKAGITLATNLPPGNSAMPAYSTGNILVGNIRPYLKKIWFADHDGGCSPDVLVFEVNKGFDPEFVYYCLFRDDFFNHMVKGSKGTKMPRGDKNQIMNFLIPDFDLSSQKKIAGVLSSMDTKIKINQRISAELKQLASLLFNYWFVQFDFPDQNGNPYKSSGGKLVLDERLSREIPAGWEVRSIGDVLITRLGGTPDTKIRDYWENGNIPWLNSGEISNFPVIESSEFITKKGVENSAATLLPKGSVLISIVRYIRPTILAIDACTNQSVVGILESSEFQKSFIYPYMQNEVPRLMKIRTGAQQPHINKEAIDSTLLYSPPSRIIQEYYEKANPIYQKLINLAFENKHLTELRNWLLPLLMNGQITVAEAENASDAKGMRTSENVDIPVSI